MRGFFSGAIYAAAVAGILAIFAVVGWVSDFLSVGTWLYPRLEPYFSPRSTIHVDLAADMPVKVSLFVEDPVNPGTSLTTSDVQQRQPAVLIVPTGPIYLIGWTGPGLEADTRKIPFVKGDSSFHLVSAGSAGSLGLKLSLVQEDPAQAILPGPGPSAGLLFSAKARAAAESSKPFAPTIVLPELDRAVSIIGFETGTTDCARHVFWMPSGGPLIGCLAFSVPGWLGDVITSLDGGEAHRLDTIVPAQAALLRNFVQNPGSVGGDAELRGAINSLVAEPEFWIQYEAKILVGYNEAAGAARKVGFVSERGRLLMFDRLVNGGPGAVNRAIREYSDKYPATSPSRPGTEAARIAALGEIFEADLRPQLPVVKQRIDTIVRGHGTIRGIAFDLDQLDVSDAG
jgi:hypothetical protein